VVSSPAFLRNHFEKHHRNRYTATLIENRLAAGADYGPRPELSSGQSGPIRIGWVGVLRCARSLDLLLHTAEKLRDRVRIEMHGQPALTEIPDFHARLEGHPNVTFHGRYRSPEDLAGIYAGLDAVWAGDFMEAGFNSLWLLPNRLYEGGYYAVPSIAPAGTQTAAWAEARGGGFALAEDLSQTLPRIIDQMFANPAMLAEKRARLLALPDATFVAERGELARLIADALGRPASPDPEPHPQTVKARA
jgi:succinoglycan biosynthesis protein ExoL